MSRLLVLVIGATGSVGRLVVDEALRAGHRVRALVRTSGRTAWADGVEELQGDLTRPETLVRAVDGVDAIVFTHGTYGSIEAARQVDYGGVRDTLLALKGRRVRMALMTAIGVTDRKGAHDWKRRAERLVRASGSPYTIVRPGWFDYNDPQQQRPVLLQGDRRQTGTPRDGVVSRRLIARVLVTSLVSKAAELRTFELVAATGSEPEEFDALFAATDNDVAGALDAFHDLRNMPLNHEPSSVVSDLTRAEEWTASGGL